MLELGAGLALRVRTAQYRTTPQATARVVVDLLEPARVSVTEGCVGLAYLWMAQMTLVFVKRVLLAPQPFFIL